MVALRLGHEDRMRWVADTLEEMAIVADVSGWWQYYESNLHGGCTICDSPIISR